MQGEPQDSAKVLITPDAVYAQNPELEIDDARLKFGYEVLSMIDMMPTKIEKDSVWHLLPMKWYNRWE